MGVSCVYVGLRGACVRSTYRSCVRAYGDVENVKSRGASQSLVTVGLGVHVGAVVCRATCMRYTWWVGVEVRSVVSHAL